MDAAKARVPGLFGRRRQGRLHRSRHMRRPRFAGSRTGSQTGTRDLPAPVGETFMRDWPKRWAERVGGSG